MRMALFEITLAFFVLSAVSGDANFTMKHTGLTIEGFTQPVVARTLIEIQANVEKGLCQRFLWIAPQPATVSFNELQQVDQEFSTALGKQCPFNMYIQLMRALWVQDHQVRKWILARPCEIFRAKYDTVQEQIRQISCMDDLLSGEWYAS